MQITETRSKTKGERLRYVAIAPSIIDAANWIEATPRRWNCQHSKTNTASQRWDRGLGYDRTLTMARTGWPEGAAMLASGLRAIPATSAPSRSARWDMAGERASVPRFLAGEPRNMSRRHRDPEAHRSAIDLQIGIVARGDVTSEEFANYGAALCAIVDSIESAGRRCEITALYTTDLPNNWRATVGWKVKSAGDVLDLGALAFSLGHAAAFRRIGFGMVERAPLASATPAYGIGGYKPKPGDNPDASPDAVYFPGLIDSNYAYQQGPQVAARHAAAHINEALGYDLVTLD